ncbi:hypothetical protein [Streptomyces microflavus]|uniref:hypothetical protein n=1 Tax=Streptomyces microflavus TaxID=1919 RepID=UPI003666E8D7
MSQLPMSTTPQISLMASAELRDALTAIEEGKLAAAVAALTAIDSESWKAIESRLGPAIGMDLRSLFLGVSARSGEAAEAAAGLANSAYASGEATENTRTH